MYVNLRRNLGKLLLGVWLIALGIISGIGVSGNLYIALQVVLGIVLIAAGVLLLIER